MIDHNRYAELAESACGRYDDSGGTLIASAVVAGVYAMLAVAAEVSGLDETLRQIARAQR